MTLYYSRSKLRVYAKKSGLASEALSRVQKQLEQNSQFLQIPYKNSVIHPYSYILLALFDTNNWTPPTVLALGPWNFQHSLPMVWGWSAREDFWIPPLQPTPGSKRCLQRSSGGPSAYFRAYFAKYTVVSYQNESFSSKWELPCLPPSSLELWRRERASRQLSFWRKTLILIGHYGTPPSRIFDLVHLWLRCMLNLKPSIICSYDSVL